MLKPIIKEKCIGCHNGAAYPNAPKFVSANGNDVDISEVTKTDDGISISTLVKISHIHMLGIPIIFYLIGGTFKKTSHEKYKKLKFTMIILPYALILLDVASWWLTKASAVFASITYVAGILMLMSFVYQWTVSMYQTWIWRCKDPDGCPIP